MDAGAYTHNEGLIPYASHYFFGEVLPLVLKTARYGLVTDSPEGIAFRRALSEIRWKLLRDVRHPVDRYAQLMDRGAVLSGKPADACALIVDRDGHRYVVLKNPASRGFIDPGTLGLSKARGGNYQGRGKKKSEVASYSVRHRTFSGLLRGYRFKSPFHFRG